MKTLKMFAWPIGIFAVGFSLFLTAMFSACAPAKADMDSYIRHIAALGYGGPINEWQTLGRWICWEEAHGADINAMVIHIVAKTGRGIYTSDAREIIQVANQELCINNGNGARLYT